ncbi:MAG TPA: hypothetical protein VIK18_04135 [Pirellulales bacterium]
MSLFSSVPEPYGRYAAEHITRLPLLAARYLRLCAAPLRERPRAPRSGRTRQRVVISLTTMPSRIGRIRPVLNSLLDQDHPADEVLLTVPSTSQREGCPYRVPDFLRGRSAVTVLECGRDWGPATKLIPAVLREAPDTLIIAVDDDNIYPRDMVSTFLRWHRQYPDAALGYRGWELPPSLDWSETQTLYATSLPGCRRVDVVTGTWGILVQPRFFDPQLTDYTAYPRDAFFVDDIWFNGHLARRDVPRMVIPALFPPLPTRASWINGLCFVENADSTRNNNVIQAFERHWMCRRAAPASPQGAPQRQTA